jgi:hypothetical protein
VRFISNVLLLEQKELFQKINVCVSGPEPPDRADATPSLVATSHSPHKNGAFKFLDYWKRCIE